MDIVNAMGKTGDRDVFKYPLKTVPLSIVTHHSPQWQSDGFCTPPSK